MSREHRLGRWGHRRRGGGVFLSAPKVGGSFGRYHADLWWGPRRNLLVGVSAPSPLPFDVVVCRPSDAAGDKDETGSIPEPWTIALRAASTVPFEQEREAIKGRGPGRVIVQLAVLVAVAAMIDQATEKSAKRFQGELQSAPAMK